MPEDKTPTEVVAEEEMKPEDKGVEVDLSGKAKEEVKPQDDLTKKISEQSDMIQNLQKQLNSLSGIRRINERLEKELGQLRQPQQIQQESQVPKDELELLKERDPWAAVDRIATLKAEEIIKQKETERQIKQIGIDNMRILERSKKEVSEKYADLNPETGNEESVISQTFNSVMNEHPEYLQNPYGPVLTMMEMEKKLESEGIDLSKLRRAASQAKTIIKRGGADATSLPPGRTGIPSDKYVLTKEQKEWCDYHGMKYEDFAKSARTLDSGEGVTV